MTTTSSQLTRRPTERDQIVREFKSACETHNFVVPMATVNLVL